MIELAEDLENGQGNQNDVLQQPDEGDRSSTSSDLTMPVGHPRLAELMSRRPQMGIYRRFGYLNAQNLLYMQAELVSLEKSLKHLQSQDAEASNAQESCRAHDWKVLSEATLTPIHEGHSINEGSASQGSVPQGSSPQGSSPQGSSPQGSSPQGSASQGPASEGSASRSSAPQGASCCGHKRCEEWCCGKSEPHEHCLQWNLAMKIREKLQRYNDALIQQINLASAGAPDSYDLEWVQHFLNSKTFEMEGALKGDDKTLWGGNGKPNNAEHDYDLIALVPLSKRDPFNEWISKWLVKRILNRKSWGHSVSNRRLDNKNLLRWTTAITSAVTATVPIVSIVALYFIKDTNVQLGVLAVFNLLAALVLYIFTEAHPMQVFAASAAYSAVNIVFIGSNATART